ATPPDIPRELAHAERPHTMQQVARADLTRIFLVILIIAMLIAGSLWTLFPFLGALIWATTIVVATWPVLLSVQRKVGGRRSIAVVILTALVLLAFIVPFAVAVSTLVELADRAPEALQHLLANGLGPPPHWLSSIPFVGARIAGKWQELSAGGPDALTEALSPYARTAAAWALAVTGGVGKLLVHVLLTVILIAILYSQGDVAAQGIRAFARRLGPAHGEETVVLAGQAVRSVALGVIVTALVQAFLAGLGLWICGVPYAAVLGAIAFVLGIAQLGPLPILVPAIIWLYSSGNTVWGTVLLVWTIPVGALDNFLRPILIRRGVQLPMLLIIAGVIGGLIVFGVVGLFVGPVVLAATYTLTRAWVVEDWNAGTTSSQQPATSEQQPREASP
ncbi:MAG TPA: AI-2E family transporter YdiK, partial [Povalibacter sp.]|nr:AI-2E family transporter YdiK [Povalibacter sp.]